MFRRAINFHWQGSACDTICDSIDDVQDKPFFDEIHANYIMRYHFDSNNKITGKKIIVFDVVKPKDCHPDCLHPACRFLKWDQWETNSSELKTMSFDHDYTFPAVGSHIWKTTKGQLRIVPKICVRIPKNTPLLAKWTKDPMDGMHFKEMTMDMEKEQKNLKMLNGIVEDEQFLRRGTVKGFMDKFVLKKKVKTETKMSDTQDTEDGAELPYLPGSAFETPPPVASKKMDKGNGNMVSGYYSGDKDSISSHPNGTHDWERNNKETRELNMISNMIYGELVAMNQEHDIMLKKASKKRRTSEEDKNMFDDILGTKENDSMSPNTRAREEQILLEGCKECGNGECLWTKYKHPCVGFVDAADLPGVGKHKNKTESKRRRYAAYRFMWFTIAKDNNAMNNQEKLPDCVVRGVRKVWPEKSGKYSTYVKM